VDAGGLDADHQRGSDLAVGVAAGDEAEHLGLARRQPQQLPKPGASLGRGSWRCEIQPCALGEPLNLILERPRPQPLGDGVGGPACSAVPASGAGSLDGMAQDPVATAASNNPELSTLVTAVKKAGLVDTLNTANGITVFAPTNDAFGALPKATLDKALGDPNGLLTTVLTYHVVQGQLTPDQLAGTHKTLQGGTVEVSGSGEDFKVNGQSSVVCGNVKTANATVYLIDQVLLPNS
jgi:uncharacterized surface protein with fasciclin (FAS1) repeats